MGYTPFTVFNYSQGLVKNRQDWLIPEGAFAELLDGYVLDGVLQSRQGYSQYATGEKGGASYCESRMVSRFNDVALSGSGAAWSATLSTPVRRGTITVTGVTPSKTLTDDGEGNLTGDGSGTINYTSGALSVTFDAGVTSATVTYDYHPGLPVMMDANFIASSNIKQLIVADTKNLNRYNPSTNRLDDITPDLSISNVANSTPIAITTSANHNLTTGNSVYIYGVGDVDLDDTTFVITRTGATTFTLDGSSATGAYTAGRAKLQFTGTATNFFHWDNYPDSSNVNRLIFTNNTDPIMYYDGATVGAYETYSGFSFLITGGGSNIVNLRCLRVHFFKDRLVLVNVKWEDSGASPTSVSIPRGIRISGTGSSSDTFDTTATGAGEINLPDRFWLNSSSLNRDDLLIYSEQNTWRLQYSGNDIIPFIPARIDHTRGSDAPMGTFTYLNRTISASRRGLVVTDGYNIQEADELIPDFVFEEVNNDEFDRVFAGSEDEDKVNYLIYPSHESETNNNESDKILILNFDQGNLATFRLPLSSMGQFQESFEIFWSNLVAPAFADWDLFGAEYSTWKDTATSLDSIVTIGGGHNGEIFRLNSSETQDNFVRIRGATNANPCVLTTDFNDFKVGDRVCISGITSGMTGLNNVSAVVSARTDNSLTLGSLDTTDTAVWGAYSSGGSVGKKISFEATTKKFNPDFQNANSIRLGWIYVYYSVTENRDYGGFIGITNASQTDPVVITTASNNGLISGDRVFIRGVGGMSEIDNRYFTVGDVDSANNTFELSNEDGTGHTAYTSGGEVRKQEEAFLDVDVLVNDTSDLVDNDDFNGTTLRLRMDNRPGVTQEKMWKKAYVNQRGNFVQLRFRSDTCNSGVRIHALILGMTPAGRLRDA